MQRSVGTISEANVAGVIITFHKRSTLPEKLTFLSGIELVKSCLDSSGV